ncbi:hypothetical protein FIM76_01310 [Helicobacter pylori]|nr:hypothetical protein FIM76_01310 [Helicobacter pylori]
MQKAINGTFKNHFLLSSSCFLVLTRLNELYSIKKSLLITPPFSNPYIFKLMKLYTDRLNNPYSYIISFVFMA